MAERFTSCKYILIVYIVCYIRLLFFLAWRQQLPSPKIMDTLDLHVPQDQEHSDMMAWAMDMEGVVLSLLMDWAMDTEGLVLVLHQQLLHHSQLLLLDP